MFGFLNSLQECIVRSGFKGRRLSKLWTDVEEAIGRKLTPPLKSFFWRELVARGKLHATDAKKLSFYLSPGGRLRTPASMPEGMGFRDPERREATNEELEQSWEAFEQEYNGMWLRIAASGQARALDLGITDPNSNMVAVTYAVLELVSKRREAGINQVDLSKALRMEAKNVFYHVKKLKKQGLIQRRKMVARRVDTDKSYQTNLLTSTRYVKGEASADADDDQEEDDEDEGDEEDAPAARGRAIMYSDVAMKVCSVLNDASNNLLVEANVQRYVSTLTGSARRGVWPTVRRKMVDANLISLASVVTVQPDGKKATMRCVQLLKMPQNSRDVDRAFEASGGASEDGSRPHKLVYDYPLEYQLWSMVHQAGQAGMFRSQTKFAGVHLKVVGKRLDTLTKDRMILTSLSTSHGKVRTFLLKSSTVPIEEAEAKLREEYAQKAKDIVAARSPAPSKIARTAKSSKALAAAAAVAATASSSQTSGANAPSSVPSTPYATPAKRGPKTPRANSMDADDPDFEDDDDDDDDIIIEEPLGTPSASMAPATPSKGLSTPSGPKHHKLPTLKSLQRKQFILKLLDEQEVLVVATIKRSLNLHEQETDQAAGEVDTKTARKIMDQLVDEGLAFSRTIGVRNETGKGTKMVDILVKAGLDEAHWRNVCREMSIDDLLRPVVPTSMTRPQLESIDGAVTLDSLDETGAIHVGKFVKKRNTPSLREGRRTSSRIDEEDDESISEESDGEPVQYAESDEDEKPTRKSRRSSRIRTETAEDAEDAEEGDDGTADNGEFNTFHHRVALGMEKAKLLRVSAIHSWLCVQLFGEDHTGALDRVLPNSVQTTVIQHFKKMTEEGATIPSLSGPGRPANSSIAAAGSDAASSSANQDAMAPGTQLSSADEQLRLMTMLMGPSRRNHPDPKVASSSSSAPPANPNKQRRGPESTSSEPFGTEMPGEMDVDSALTWESARKRWFDGPEFNIDMLLPEMPLYIYMMAIGLAGNPPGLNLYQTSLETKIRDLPPETSRFLLQRSQYARAINSIMEMLKQLNLIHPKVSLVREGEEEAEVSQQPIVPYCTLNPIGIIWYSPLTTGEPQELSKRAERTFMYQFDRPPTQQGAPEVSNYWWRLQRESLSFIREVSMQGVEMYEANTPPPTRAFPTAPGLPLVCCSNTPWTGTNHKRTTKAFKAQWKVVEKEMAEATSGGPTDTMMLLAEQWNVKPTTVQRWYQDYQKRLNARRKAREESALEAGAPPAKRAKGRGYEEELEPSATQSLRAAQTSTQRASITRDIINIELPKTRARARRAGAGADEGDEDGTGRGGDDGDADDSNHGITRHRWTHKDQQNFLDHFVQMKAASGAHLDDLSTLFEGIDRAKLARAADKPWETLEKTLKQHVSSKVGLYNMASKISVAMRRRLETQAEPMEVDAVVAPVITIELPASIDDFRKGNSIIYTSSADSAVVQEERSVTFQGHHANRSVAVAPLHPNLIAESEFFNFTDHYDSATCSRAPASRWMLPLPATLDPNYLVVSDFVKSMLMVEPDLDLKTVISRIVPKELNKTYTQCMDSLKQRKVLTQGKSNERTKLSAQWLGWTKHADQAIKFGKEARQTLDRLADEHTGWDPLTQSSPAPMHGPPRDAHAEGALLHPWSQHFDPFSSGAEVASILHETYCRDIVLDVTVDTVSSPHRRFRKQSLKVPKMTKSSNTEEDVSVRFQWWKEHRIFARYGFNNEDFTTPCDWDHIADAEVRGPGKPEILHLGLTSAKKSQPSVWDVFVATQKLLGRSEEFVALCESALTLIRAVKSNAIELFDLEQQLVDDDKIESEQQQGEGKGGAFAGGHARAIPTYEASQALEESLQALENHRLVFRVLGGLGDAWVSAEHATRWTIVYLRGNKDGAEEGEASSSITSNEEGDEDLVVYHPWTNLDGSLNEQTLNRLRAHIALSIISSPGISEERVLDTFDVFRPAVAKEILRLLHVDGIVTFQYTKYSVPTWSKAHANLPTDSSHVEFATEVDYHRYIRQQYAHVRTGAPPPSEIIHKGIWPAEDIYTRL